MTEASVSFAGNLTDDPELRPTKGGMARATFQVAVSSRREREPSFFTVVVWRDQAEHASQSLIKGRRVDGRRLFHRESPSVPPGSDDRLPRRPPSRGLPSRVARPRRQAQPGHRWPVR